MNRISNNGFRFSYIYFHGFNSNKDSSTGLALSMHFGESVLRMEYDYINPEFAFYRIEIILNWVFKSNKFPILIGNSLGGFWANYFANKYLLNSVLINPCYKPSELLMKYVGQNINHNSNEIKELKRINVEEYKKYEEMTNKPLKRIVLISENDEIVSPLANIQIFKNIAHVIVCPNQTHRFNDNLLLFKSIEDLKINL